MSKYYHKKDNYGYRQYNHRKTNHFKRPYNNNYISYNKRYKNSYDIYEEEIYYDNEAALSNKAPSTKDGSFSQSSNSNSRKQSYCENNNNENNEDNKDSSIIVLESNSLEKSKIDNVPKINLSENELKEAFFKPKNFKENSVTKIENNNKEKNENIIILDISVKISKDKIINFKLRKYDDMFQVIDKTCQEYEIDKNYTNFFAYYIIKALNSIYGIYNLNLKEEEIKFLRDLKERIKDE